MDDAVKASGSPLLFPPVLPEVSLGVRTSLNDERINGTATTIHFSRA